jgi:hypothetical protein
MIIFSQIHVNDQCVNPDVDMADENKSDIHIGETERIHWVEFEASNNDLIEMDYVIANHNDFWEFLEIYCVAECCGLDAFRFYPDDIKIAASHIDQTVLKSDLLRLKYDLLVSDKDVVVSSRFNNLVEKTVFIKLLDHIISNLS